MTSRTKAAMKPWQKSKKEVRAQIRGMVKRIVEQFHPDKIILFGSQARGDAGPDSDVDLLVVMPFEGRKLDKIVEIGAALSDFTVPLDILVSTPEQLAVQKEIPGTAQRAAVREGKVLYVRRA